jgi:hypothetical protein
MPPIWPFGKKTPEHDPEIIEFISPQGHIMRKKCIRGCDNTVATGNINYCSKKCKISDEKDFALSGGMVGNIKPL